MAKEALAALQPTAANAALFEGSSSFDDWLRIDALEVARGEAAGETGWWRWWTSVAAAKWYQSL